MNESAPGFPRSRDWRSTARRFLDRSPSLLPFFVALVWIVSLEGWFRDEAAGRLYFHAWSSEYMMQTISVRDLRAEPFRSLWYNHIQPPGLDAIRALLVAASPGTEGAALIRRVDAGLYLVWMGVYAATAALVFSWIRRSGGTRSAIFGFALFLLLPGPIFYATFLDGTLLSATLVLCFFWTLWLFANGARNSMAVVLASTALVVTRSVFQWPFVVVFGASLWCLGVTREKAWRVLLPIALLVVAYQAKQYVLFGLTTTSSFGPDSFCKSLSQRCPGTKVVPLPPLTDRANAVSLRHLVKLNGEYNYNQMAFLKTSFSEMAEYKERLGALSPGEALDLLKVNLGIYLRPTSRHSAHVIVDRLPWRESLDFISSGWRLLCLLGMAGLVILRRSLQLDSAARRRAGWRFVGFALPALYIAAVSVLFESGENMRYRFFLEPTVFVFLWLAFFAKSGALIDAQTESA